MYTSTSAFLLLTLSVNLSSVQARVARTAPVCREDSQLRALEHYPHFANQFCPAYLAGNYPHWLDHWNKKEVSSACSCYQKKATSHGVSIHASPTATSSFSSTAPAALSSVFATTTASPSASSSASHIIPTSSASPSASLSVSASSTGLVSSSSISSASVSASASTGFYPTGASSGAYYPTGSASSGRIPSGTASRGIFPSGSVFGSSGSMPTMTGTAPASSANTTLPTVPNRGVSPLSSSASSSSASVSASSSVIASATSSIAESSSSVSSAANPSGTSSLPAGDNYPPQPPGEGPGKRGLVYNSDTLIGWSTLFDNSKYATYGSNGGLDRGTQLDESFHFVPTLTVDENLNNAEWETAIPVLIEGGTKAIFASTQISNSQNNLTAAQAATAHQKYMQPHAGTVQLGTPAVTNSATGLSYLEDFVTACTSCRFNFIDVRYYADRADTSVTAYAQGLHDYIENNVADVQARHPQLKGLPIFVSGWWLNGVSAEEGDELMTDLLPYLDNNPNILAHQASAGLLQGGFINAAANGLTPAGQRYADWTADVSSLFG